MQQPPMDAGSGRHSPFCFGSAQAPRAFFQHRRLAAQAGRWRYRFVRRVKIRRIKTWRHGARWPLLANIQAPMAAPTRIRWVPINADGFLLVKVRVNLRLQKHGLRAVLKAKASFFSPPPPPFLRGAAGLCRCGRGFRSQTSRSPPWKIFLQSPPPR